MGTMRWIGMGGRVGKANKLKSVKKVRTILFHLFRTGTHYLLSTSIAWQHHSFDPWQPPTSAGLDRGGPNIYCIRGREVGETATDVDFGRKDAVVFNPPDASYVLSTLSLVQSQFIFGRAIDHRQVITDFVGKHGDLHPYDLDVNDWESIVLVNRWLKSFRTATTLMSITKRPMISSTHAIFRGLQEDLRLSLIGMPTSTLSVLQNGVVEAHRKLSDYYYKVDESPFYTWATRK
jgi:hypothetical protein